MTRGDKAGKGGKGVSSTRGVRLAHPRLSYTLSGEPQRDAEIDHPLFAVLRALAEAPSIVHAARLLGLSYRHVWGLLREWEAALGEPLVVWSQGFPARLSDFGQRLLWAELRARKRLQPHIEALRSELSRVVDEARNEDRLVLTMFASHDLALPRLRDLADPLGLQLAIRFAGSIDGLHALNVQRCLVAGFQVPALRGAAPGFSKALRPLLEPGVHKLIGCARRTQGLMMRKEHAGAVRTLADLAERAPAPARTLRFVNRQAGSGTRLLMDHLLSDQGLRPRDVDGYEDRIEESHVAVAACIASGAADIGPGVEAAAIEFGLHFVPLVEEDYFLVCQKPQLEHPAVVRLRELLASPAWARMVASLPGYRVARAPGEVLSMTAALPWWRFAAPKAKKNTERSSAEGPADA